MTYCCHVAFRQKLKQFLAEKKFLVLLFFLEDLANRFSAVTFWTKYKYKKKCFRLKIEMVEENYWKTITEDGRPRYGKTSKYILIFFNVRSRKSKGLWEHIIFQSFNLFKLDLNGKLHLLNYMNISDLFFETFSSCHINLNEL